MKKNMPSAHQKKRGIRLCLYVANTTPRSVLAITNLQKFCEQYLGRGYRVRIIDIVKDPDSAYQDNILATPTLVRTQPTPKKTLIGSLSEPAALLRALDLEPAGQKRVTAHFSSAKFVQEPGAA